MLEIGVPCCFIWPFGMIFWFLDSVATFVKKVLVIPCYEIEFFWLS